MSLPQNIHRFPANLHFRSSLDLTLGLLSNYFPVIALVAIAAGLAGWGIGALLPNQYTSAVYLRLDESTARSADAIMSAAPVLDKVLAKVPVAGDTLDARRRRLDAERSLAVAPNEIPRSGTLFLMEVRDADPKRAQDLNRAFLDAWLEATKPGPDTKALLDRQIERAERELKWTFESIEQTRRESSASPAATVLGTAVLGSPVTALIGKYDEIGTALEKLQRQAEGMSRDVVISDPTLPDEPHQPWRLPAIVLSIAIAELLLFTYLWLRRRS